MKPVAGYLIQRLLDNSAGAKVYLAEEEGHGRLVVLKVLEDGEGASARRDEFLGGAALQQQLVHPGIVPVYAVGADLDQVYIITAYAAGSDLRQRLEAGIRVGNFLEVLTDVAQALDFIHQEGWVHLDVSASNILLDQGGRARLNDFGSAQSVGESVRTSVDGTISGTPRYMSPEQLRGEVVDGRSDLYSLGVVAFEGLTGMPPYEGVSAGEIAERQLVDPLPRLPDHLGALQPVLAKVLAKEPDARFPTALAFAEALRSAAAESQLAMLTLRSAPVGTQEIRAVGAAILASARKPRRERESRIGFLERPGIRLSFGFAIGLLTLWWAVALVDRSDTAARVLAVVGLVQDPAVAEAWDSARALHRDPNQSLATVVGGYRRVLSLDPGYERAKDALDELADESRTAIERALAQGNGTLAAGRLGEYLLVFPTDPQVAEFSDRISNRRTADALVNNALAQLRMNGIGDEASATLAIRSYHEVLRLVPEHPVAQTELDVLADYYANQAAQSAAAGDLDGAIANLDRATSANPAHQRLAQVRNQLLGGTGTAVALEQLLGQATDYRSAGALIDPPGGNAAELYHRVLATDPDNAAAISGFSEVVDQLIASIHDYLNAGDLVSAGELVSRAGEIGLDQAGVVEIRSRLEAELGRFRQVARNLEDAEQLLRLGYLTEPAERNAVLLLHEVEDIDPGNQAAAALLTRCATRLAEVAREAYEYDMKNLGRAYLDLALSVRPGNPEWQSLRDRWESGD